jgi:large subunit ribosomal protein L1
MDKKEFLKALQELRKGKKRKFTQSVELIINLRNFDVKRQNINIAVEVPHRIKDRKVCAFLTKKNSHVDTITKDKFDDYKDKKEMKQLLKKYDSFIAVAPVMPAVATSFGKVLGPAGKMPSPQLGILPSEDEKPIKDLLGRINRIVKIKSKEPSLKITIGKEDLKDEELAENAVKIYTEVFKVLPRQKENIKSILIKFTMTKPIKIKTD